MVAAVAIVTSVLAAGVALVVGVSLGRRAGREAAHAAAERAGTSLRDELRRAVEEQRRVADDGRDAAIHAALGQLETMHRALAAREHALGAEELDGKKALIDQQLAAMAGELAKVERLVHDLEHDRQAKFGELSNELRRQHEGVTALTRTTQSLREALSSTRARGQWGERMAEDVLRLAGFLEGVNYRKQQSVEGNRTVPDFTFLLPNELVLHMDVKFPLDNYLRFLETESELERRRHRDQFLRDVRDRVKELTGRGYLDATDATVDCLLLFIPNEQVYAFVQEHDRTVLEDALRQKVVLCSPLTLFAVLAVIRQAVDNFRLERTSDEILSLLGEFSTQWERYTGQLEAVQRRLDGAVKDYDLLMGRRHRMLQRPLDRIAALRAEREASSSEPAPSLALDA